MNFHRILCVGGLILFAGCARHYEARLPIDYVSKSGQPRTVVSLEGKYYPFVIDLGDSGYCAISSRLLTALQQKRRTSSVRTIDFRGNEYLSDMYLIPELSICNLRLKDIEVSEETLDFVENASISQHRARSVDERAKEKPGRIGRRLFVEHYNVLLDFHNSVMFACCHLHHRVRDGYQLHALVSTPLGIGHEEGIFFKVDTDLGPKIFMLDTGASHNFIKPQLVQDLQLQKHKRGTSFCTIQRFAIGSKEFGPQQFALLEMAPALEKIDGILGMSFLKNHVIYLDFENRMIYVGKAEEVSANIRPRFNRPAD